MKRFHRISLDLPRKATRLLVSPVERNRILFQMDVRRQKPRLIATPVNLHLETTNRCNLSCRSCGRNYWDSKLNPLGDMSRETARKLDPFLKRSASTAVWGYGESLLHPHFFDLLDHVRAFEGETQLFTNGTTLTEGNVSRLVERKLNSLVISLDGATTSRVQETRSGISLQNLIASISRLNDMKQRRGAKYPSLSFSFTASKSNIDELLDVIRLGKGLNVCTVYVGIARIFSPYFVKDSLLNDPEAATSKIASARELGRSLGIEVIMQDLGNVGCRQPFEMLFVKWNGDVFGCCASAFHANPRLQVFLGNVHELSLDEIWNGAHMRSVRSGLLGQGPLADVCRSCPHYTMTLSNLQKYLLPARVEKWAP